MLLAQHTSFISVLKTGKDFEGAITFLLKTTAITKLENFPCWLDEDVLSNIFAQQISPLI